MNIQAEQEHWALPTPEPEYPGYPGSRIVYTLHPRLGDNSSYLEPRARVLYLLQVTTCTIQCTVWVNVRSKGLVYSVLFTVGVSVRSIGLVCTVLCTVWVNVRSVGLVCTVQCTVWVNVRFVGLVCNVQCTVLVSVRSIGLAYTVQCTVCVVFAF